MWWKKEKVKEGQVWQDQGSCTDKVTFEHRPDEMLFKPPGARQHTSAALSKKSLYSL